eukprot:Cvel_14151.t1-p1 / transcript=Cvel_14151.t1 / gene=Cvel_14151 / organism=Chromera_velia_CCMP2878 / gene_product=NAD-dependent methanol dehydrogenase, putative / transcript_product=NAD-dependent methanol dehydrogenase, putative / location=Cvel_scaffold997:7214-11383(-) / protein_length=660 / sequence_SO=supercontig / SO=protein_coding / is_pseudo=false
MNSKLKHSEKRKWIPSVPLILLLTLGALPINNSFERMKLATAALFAVGATAAPFDLDFDFDLSKLRNENSSGLKFGGDRGGKRYFDFKNIFGDREEGSLFSDTGSSGLFTKKEDKLGTVKEVKRTKPDLACPKDFCQNGGECVGKKPNFFCNCPKGFTGTNCQTAVDFCSALSCGDQPIPLECVSLSTGFECRLPETDVTDPNSLFVNGNEVLVFTSDTEADIQMKIDTAAEFDTIIFEAGLYTEIALTIPKSLKIVGAGSGSDPSLDTILDGDFNDGVAFDIAGGDVWIIESIRISEYNTAGVRVQDGLPGEVLVLDNLWVEFNGSHGLQIGFNVIQQQLKKTIVKNSTFLENGSPDTGSSQILFFQYTGAAEIENVEAARMLVSNPGPIEDIVGPMGRPMRPHPSLFACVPTTAGTGSEVSESAIVAKAGTDYKMVLRNPNMGARLAILDPELSVSAPAMVTASAGYDAVTHAVEAFTSNFASAMTDPFAESAMRLLARHLETAVTEPENLEARGACLVGAMQAGIAFNSANLGLAHAIAGALGALHHTPHGLANALGLPWTMTFNEPALGPKGPLLAEIFGGETAGHGLSRLRHAIALDLSLDREAEGADALDRIADGAAKSGQIKMNPRPADAAQIRVILEHMRTPTGGARPHLNL